MAELSEEFSEDVRPVPELEMAEMSVDKEKLSKDLNVPVSVLESLSNCDEHKIIFEKVAEMILVKSQELEEYESALRDFSDTHDDQIRKQKDEWIPVDAD